MTLKSDKNKRYTSEVVQVVAASNSLYVPYLATMIRSIMEYISDVHQYVFTIMHTDISSAYQIELQNMVEEVVNCSIKFINVSEEMQSYAELFISNHIKIETYYRLLLPKLMPDVDKVLYVDCDVIANTDIYALYKINIDDYYLAGTRDADSAANYVTDFDYKTYIDTVVQLPNPYEYFQAGIILMNLKKFRESCNTKKMLDTAMSRQWRFHDQDTLNYLCKGNVYFVDYAWNFVYDYCDNFRRSKNVIINAPHYIMTDYMRAKENPKMIHYSWVNKPWFSPGVHYGEKFWMMARKTPFYNEMLWRVGLDLGNYILNN